VNNKHQASLSMHAANNDPVGCMVWVQIKARGRVTAHLISRAFRFEVELEYSPWAFDFTESIAIEPSRNHVVSVLPDAP
jgi:hypothetical protein